MSHPALMRTRLSDTFRILGLAVSMARQRAHRSGRVEGAEPAARVLLRAFRSLFSIAFILAALLIEAGFTGLFPLAVRFFIDGALIPRNYDAFRTMIRILAGAALLAVAAGLLRDVLSVRLQSHSLRGLRGSMFERLQRLGMSFRAHEHTATLLEHFSTDFAAVENAVELAIPRGALPGIEALLATSLMFWLDWRAGLIGLLLWPWIVLEPRISAARVSRATEACRNDQLDILGALRETLLAQPIVRAFSLEQIGIAGFQKSNEKLSRSKMRAGLLSALMERFIGSGVLGVRAFLLALSAWLAFNRQMSIGTLVALQMLVSVVGGSLLCLIEFLPSIGSAREAFERIDESLKAPQAVEYRHDARFLPPLRTEIVFANVDFSYDPPLGPHQKKNPHLALRGIRARIPRGASVAFVGHSGCGKSTMLRLLTRFYDPSAGFIAIDGHDLRSVTQTSLRSRIGVVLQENPLFNVSIRENIRLGKPDASEESVIEMAKAVGLHDFIRSLPQGYGTLAGERGVRLSTSRMQRLAMARAMLRDPEIVLLDEATSALDAADEKAIAEMMRSLAKGRTLISVTHRLSTAADADHIFVFDEGRIVEQGSHFELMALNGTYADLWRKQAGFTFSADGTHVDIDAQRLKAFPILENLDDGPLTELAPYFATETFQPGRDIVRQNDPGDKFYIIARGKVEVWKTEEQSGATTQVAVLQDGDYFGEITLITGFPRTATVRTATVCTCLSLERGQFNRMLDRFPELRRQMSEVGVRRLRESSRAAADAVSAPTS